MLVSLNQYENTLEIVDQILTNVVTRSLATNHEKIVTRITEALKTGNYRDKNVPKPEKKKPKSAEDKWLDMTEDDKFDFYQVWKNSICYTTRHKLQDFVVENEGFDKMSSDILIKKIIDSMRKTKRAYGIIIHNKIMIGNQLFQLQLKWNLIGHGTWRAYLKDNIGKGMSEKTAQHHIRLFKFFKKFPNIQYCGKPCYDLLKNLSLLELAIGEYGEIAYWTDVTQLPSYQHYNERIKAKTNNNVPVTTTLRPISFASEMGNATIFRSEAQPLTPLPVLPVIDNGSINNICDKMHDINVTD